MGREVSGSKGFFLAVIVLLALAIFVSYWGDSTAGQAIRSQGPGNQEPRCTTDWQIWCSFTVDSTTLYFATEAGVKSASLKKCEENKKDTIQEMTNCITVHRNQCPIPCTFTETDRKDTTSSNCIVVSCSNNIKSTSCVYEYDQRGNRIEPGRCTVYSYELQSGWSCTAHDGYMSSTLICKL